MKKTIYIVPIVVYVTDFFTDELWANLKRWLESWYPGLNVEILKQLGEDSLQDVKNKRNQWGEMQYQADVIIAKVLKPMQLKQKESFGVYCFTDVDLYSAGCQGFVYGCANKTARCGIQSLFRNQFTQSTKGFLKTATHEIGHMFGLPHCTYYCCQMRGTMHPGENHPLTFCPVCIRKTFYQTKVTNYYKYYDDLSKLCEEFGFDEEKDWYERRAKYLQGIGLDKSAQHPSTNLLKISKQTSEVKEQKCKNHKMVLMNSFPAGYKAGGILCDICFTTIGAKNEIVVDKYYHCASCKSDLCGECHKQ